MPDRYDWDNEDDDYSGSEISDGDGDGSFDNNEQSPIPRPSNVLYAPRMRHDIHSSQKQNTEPLINFVKNDWQNSQRHEDDNEDNENDEDDDDLPYPRKDYNHLPAPWTEYEDLPEWLEFTVMTISAPKFRRNAPIILLSVIVLFCLWKIYITPQLVDHEILSQSLDPQLKEAVGGWFGSNLLPEFDDLIKVGTLDQSVIPADVEVKGSKLKQKRLIIIGDVHGCKAECMCSSSAYPFSCI